VAVAGRLPGDEAAAHEEDLGCGHVVESVLHLDPQEAAVVGHDTRFGGAEGDLRTGQVGEDVVEADDVERGEAGVEADGDLHGTTMRGGRGGGNDGAPTDPATGRRPAADGRASRRLGVVPQMIPYDEFGLFHENAAEFGLPYDGPPVVRREHVEVAPGRRLSALVWGDGAPELVLLHGGAQNAHTWDTVAMALGRSLVAIDLPGHGHSDGPAAGSADLATNALDVAVVIEALAPSAGAVVGMSLGGMTAMALAGQRPDLVRRLVLVDITPGVDDQKAAEIVAFVDGPESFADFDELLARTMAFNPTRSESSLRRGILHNAVQREDGSWVWRYRRFVERGGAVDASALWEVLSRLTVPVMLLRGMRSQSVVGDADEAELLRRLPGARIEHVAEAGHSIQGDDPLTLARLLDDFVSG
jgi:pimeloyl-ACP methyl ester carboxylesterase